MDKQYARIESEAYFLNPAHFTALYFGNVARKFWYVTLFVALGLLAQIVFTFAKDPFPLSLILPAVFVCVFFYIRFRMIQRFKNLEGLGEERQLIIQNNQLQFSVGSGQTSIIPIESCISFKEKQKDLEFRLNDGRLIWVPLNAFKTDQIEAIKKQFSIAKISE